jgi:ABC-type multidrug transport system ATPase subunit
MADSPPLNDEELPTLELKDVAIRRAGAVLLSSLELSSRATMLGLVGDWQALTQVLTGKAQITGSARVLGHELRPALGEGILGFAPCDPPLAGRLSVREYLNLAAHLGHGSSARALVESARALQEYGLAELGARKLRQLAPFERRALGIAAAAVNRPPVVFLEAPLRGLDAQTADYVAGLCAQAAKHSRVIVSATFPSAPSPERALLEGCQELCVLSRGAVVAKGAPNQIFSPGTRYLLEVSGANLAAFAASLRDAGCGLTERDAPGRYAVELPKHGTSDLLLDAALAENLVVLELQPLSTSE